MKANSYRSVLRSADQRDANFASSGEKRFIFQALGPVDTSCGEHELYVMLHIPVGISPGFFFLEEIFPENPFKIHLWITFQILMENFQSFIFIFFYLY